MGSNPEQETGPLHQSPPSRELQPHMGLFIKGLSFLFDEFICLETNQLIISKDDTFRKPNNIKITKVLFLIFFSSFSF